MSFAKSIIFTLATAALASPSLAASGHMSDSQFVAVGRCQGLAGAKALGTIDPAPFAAMLKTQSTGRIPQALDRADEARDDAARQASHAGPTARSALIAERDGACHRLVETNPAMSPANGGGGR